MFLAPGLRLTSDLAHEHVQQQGANCHLVAREAVADPGSGQGWVKVSSPDFPSCLKLPWLGVQL